MRRLRLIMDHWEAAVLAGATSPLASLALLIFAACWIGVEAVRGKWIGWDGALTIIACEIALATLRGRRKET